jgi:type I restriction enzyme S subunit
MGEWREITIGELLKLQRGHDLPQSEFVNGPYQVAGSNGAIGFHNKFTTLGPGLTIGRSGNSIGVAHYYEKDFWAHNTVLYGKEFYGSDPKFIYFLLKSIDFKSLDAGSAIPSLNRNHVHPITVRVPIEIDEQKAIAEVLSSLDDKIDLLRRQNNTLESLAQTLFRQWFIEEADDSWKTGTLSDISINVRKSVSVAGISDEVKYVALEHIEKRHIALYACGEGKTVASNKSEFKRNDILFGKLRPYFHKVCFAPFSGICSTDILVIRPKEEIFFPYCLFAYFQDEVVDYSDLASEGTRMPRTNWEILGNFSISIPDRETLRRFNEVALPSIEKIEANVAEIASLNTMRDALLPKLMNGEASVS